MDPTPDGFFFRFVSSVGLRLRLALLVFAGGVFVATFVTGVVVVGVVVDEDIEGFGREDEGVVGCGKKSCGDSKNFPEPEP